MLRSRESSVLRVRWHGPPSSLVAQIGANPKWCLRLIDKVNFTISRGLMEEYLRTAFLSLIPTQTKSVNRAHYPLSQTKTNQMPNAALCLCKLLRQSLLIILLLGLAVRDCPIQMIKGHKCFFKKRTFYTTPKPRHQLKACSYRSGTQKKCIMLKWSSGSEANS